MMKPGITITEDQDIELDPRTLMSGICVILPKSKPSETRQLVLGMTCVQCNAIHQHVLVSVDEAKEFRAMLDEVICRAETGASRQ